MELHKLDRQWLDSLADRKYLKITLSVVALKLTFFLVTLVQLKVYSEFVSLPMQFCFLSLNVKIVPADFSSPGTLLVIFSCGFK